jgi:transcriptional regulator with XRE-family HTH domain
MDAKISADSPNDDDKRIGARLRFWRRIVNTNAKQLAKKLNITYQQLQKYEKGINRVSASRLHRIARELRVPIGYFYQDLEPIELSTLNSLAEDRAQQLSKAANFVPEQAVSELCKALNKIHNPSTRKAIIGLITEIASRNN